MENLDLLIKQEQENYDGLAREYKQLQKLLHNSRRRLDGYLKEFHKEDFKDIAWLIQNPAMPDAEGELSGILLETYRLAGYPVSSSGYVHDGNYFPIQANIKLNVEKLPDGTDNDVKIMACVDFMEKYLTCFKPYEDVELEDGTTVTVVGFSFLMLDNGVHVLGYHPEENVWYYYTMTRITGRAQKKFETLEEALRHASYITELYRDYD